MSQQNVNDSPRCGASASASPSGITENAEQYPGSTSMTSIASYYSTTSSTGSWMHNPYSLKHPMVEVGVEYNSDDEDTPEDPELVMHRGTMVLLLGVDGQETVRSKAEVVQSVRKVHGFVDSEVATPCGHVGRLRLRYKNSITHCRCRECGLKWREIAFSRIRPEQMEEFQRSCSAAQLL